MRTIGALAAIATLAMAAGCTASAANPRLALRYEAGWNTTNLAAVVGRAAPGDVAIVNLGSTAWVSHHVAVVRTEEKPHYHRFHDLTVVALRGEGVLNVEQRKIPLKAGDAAHINRGTPHFFRNTGSEPAVALIVFSPPFDGRDTVVAEIGAEQKQPAEKKTWWPF